MISGKQIAAGLEAKGWTQAELAEKTGVFSETVSKWKQDACSPDEVNAETLRGLPGLDHPKEDGTPSSGRLFSEDHMSAFLKEKFSTGNFPNAGRALAFAEEKHAGKYRKPEDLQIPYIIHPLTMACHALAMGLEDDALLAAILLHDVCEDCGVEPEELPVCEEAQELVRLVTKVKGNFSEEEYYGAILGNPKACLVKCIDRCNNVSGMAVGFKPAKIREYIAETGKWYPGLLQAVKAVPEYNNAAWLLGYQIRSLLQTAEKIG